MALFKRKPKLSDTARPEETQEKAVQKILEPLEDGTVRTQLVFHSEWENAPQEKYIYHYQHQQLPRLMPNQISITGVKLQEFDKDLFVICFLRNTLERPIQFETIDLLLLDENHQPFAKQSFEMDDLGELPPMSCMPWNFLFTEEYIFGDTIPPKDQWKIAFELKSASRKHALDLAPSWEQQLSTEQKEQLESLVNGLPKLSPGEVNFMGMEAKLTEDQALAVTVLIRNGNNKNIKFEQIPLVVEDTNGDIVTQGAFQLEDFEVKANTSKPWTFIFPKELILKESPDLSSWKVYPPQQN